MSVNWDRLPGEVTLWKTCCSRVSPTNEFTCTGAYNKSRSGYCLVLQVGRPHAETQVPEPIELGIYNTAIATQQCIWDSRVKLAGIV